MDSCEVLERILSGKRQLGVVFVSLLEVIVWR